MSSQVFGGGLTWSLRLCILYQIVTSVLAQPHREGGSLFPRNSSKVLEVSADEFNATVSSSVGKIVLFYSHWCGHCIRFAPEYEKMAKSLGSDALWQGKQPRVIAVDCAMHTLFCHSKNILGYPSVVLYRNGEEEDHYDRRGKEKLEGFARRVLQLDVRSGSPLPSVALPSVGHYESVAPLADKESVFEHEQGISFKERIFDGQLSFVVLLYAAMPYGGETALLKSKMKVLKEQILPVVAVSFPDEHFRRKIATLQESIHDGLAENEGAWATALDSIFPQSMREAPVAYWKHCTQLTCGLWQFFHALTVGVGRPQVSENFLWHTQENALNTGAYVMACIRATVSELLLCEECVEHFVTAYDACAADRCTMKNPDREHTAMWLWRFHNIVNNRTSHEKRVIGKDTAWPNKDECKDCRDETLAATQFFNEAAVYRFLLESYGEPLFAKSTPTKVFLLPQLLLWVAVACLMGYYCFRRKKLSFLNARQRPYKE